MTKEQKRDLEDIIVRVVEREIKLEMAERAKRDAWNELNKELNMLMEANG